MATVASEIKRLRAEIEEYRQRELDDLRTRLDKALADVERYRAEAYRNAETGKKIAAEYQKEVEALRIQLQAYTLPNMRPRNAIVGRDS